MDNKNKSRIDKELKINQIISFLEIIHSQVKKYSKKREIVFIDSCAGNCYLSFLVYYYYNEIDNRNVTIHCVDWNEKLMENGWKRAHVLGFLGMRFHAGDCLDFKLDKKVELVYSLHACDTATDKSIYCGMANRASTILNVSCCQHTIRDSFRSSRYRAISKHRVFKDRMVTMVGDSMRALLLEMEGYRADIFEFTSSRNTDKNVMIRARNMGPVDTSSIRIEYEKMRDEFRVAPELEKYIGYRNDGVLKQLRNVS